MGPIRSGMLNHHYCSSRYKISLYVYFRFECCTKVCAFLTKKGLPIPINMLLLSVMKQCFFLKLCLVPIGVIIGTFADSRIEGGVEASIVV